MAKIVVDDLDDITVEELKIRAEIHGRSLGDEVRMILMEALGRSSKKIPTSKEFRATAERIAAMTPDVPQTDSTEIIRKQRDS